MAQKRQKEEKHQMFSNKATGPRLTAGAQAVLVSAANTISDESE